MRLQRKIKIVGWIIVGQLAVCSVARGAIQIVFGKSFEIGREESTFGTIASVAEDKDGNIYVLDSSQFVVFKFSPDGRFLLRFGAKGQGPGDFRSPSQVILTARGELAVLEDISYVSFFTPEGKFLSRTDVNGCLGPRYLGPDRYLGWTWEPAGCREVLVDARNKLIRTFDVQPRDSFSVAIPDESGRAVMFNYSSTDHVPALLMESGPDIGLVGIGSRYELTLLNGAGKVTGTVRREVGPGRMSSRERAYLEQKIRALAKERNWPSRAASGLIDKVPDHKSIIRAVRISPEAIFVFRVPEDISRENSPMPVDVFSLRGDLRGTTTLNEIPVFVSSARMYFVETDKEGNEFLKLQGYSIIEEPRNR